MISPKTALASALLEASSACASVKDFVGEPDSSHSGVITFMLCFKALLFYQCWTSKLWSFSRCPSKLHSSSFCSVRLPTNASVLTLFVPLWELPVQYANDRHSIAMGTELHNDFYAFCSTVEFPHDVLDITQLICPLSLDSSPSTANLLLL